MLKLECSLCTATQIGDPQIGSMGWDCWMDEIARQLLHQPVIVIEAFGCQ